MAEVHEGEERKWRLSKRWNDEIATRILVMI
jgi:hypothetical protein